MDTPHNFPPELELDIQQKMEDSGILSLCTPHINFHSIDDTHSLFKEINDSLHSFFYPEESGLSFLFMLKQSHKTLFLFLHF